jgi:hypothetical protein
VWKHSAAGIGARAQALCGRLFRVIEAEGMISEKGDTSALGDFDRASNLLL